MLRGAHKFISPVLLMVPSCFLPRGRTKNHD